MGTDTYRVTTETEPNKRAARHRLMTALPRGDDL